MRPQPLVFSLPTTALREQVRPRRRSTAEPEFRSLVSRALDLLAEDPLIGHFTKPYNHEARRRLLQALLTIREPAPMNVRLVIVLDRLLGLEGLLRRTVDVTSLRLPGFPAAPCTALWRGNITALRADAIMTITGSSLLGCFLPMHNCVGNAVHNAAGPRLREDCQAIALAQGGSAAVGSATITRGYHLSARYVLHTVPPGSHELAADYEHLLAGCYRAALDLASTVPEIRTVALKSVSPAHPGFAHSDIARITLDAIAGWCAARPARFGRIVLVTGNAKDTAAHREQMSRWEQ